MMPLLDQEMKKIPQKGDKVRFEGLHGYNDQIAQAKKHFTVGKIYEVEDVQLHPFEHSIKLTSVPGMYFNGVMFVKVVTP